MARSGGKVGTMGSTVEAVIAEMSGIMLKLTQLILVT